MAGIARSVQELSQVNSHLYWVGQELVGIGSGIDALNVGVARVEDAVVDVGQGVAAVGGEVAAVHSSVDRVGDRVDRVGNRVDLVTSAVLGLETRLSLKLEDEAVILLKQVDLLTEIRDTLRSPMATTAIERVSQSGELLRRQMYDEALDVAESAIESDRTNAAARRAAAWAAMGLHKLELARDFFADGARLSDGDEASKAWRQAARLGRALEGSKEALLLLSRSPVDRLGELETRALAYDGAIYSAESDLHDRAATLMREACVDPDFCLMALNDSLVAPFEHLRSVAGNSLADHLLRFRRLRTVSEGRRHRLEQQLAAVREQANALGLQSGQLELEQRLSRLRARLDSASQPATSLTHTRRALIAAHDDAVSLTAATEQWLVTVETEQRNSDYAQMEALRAEEEALRAKEEARRRELEEARLRWEALEKQHEEEAAREAAREQAERERKEAERRARQEDEQRKAAEAERRKVARAEAVNAAIREVEQQGGHVTTRTEHDATLVNEGWWKTTTWKITSTKDGKVDVKHSAGRTASNPGPWLVFGTPVLGIVIMFIAEPKWFFFALGVAFFIGLLCIFGWIYEAVNG